MNEQGAAVRHDQRPAARRERVVGLDATLSVLQRLVSFDRDDMDGAIAELDRLHDQADAS